MKPKNFGWNRVKLSSLSYEELEILEAQVKEDHACQDGIFIYDEKGRKKLDALSWAVYYKNTADRKVK